MQDKKHDRWAEWMLRQRFVDDDAMFEAALDDLSTYRQIVLDGAQISPGNTVLDVGTGDGMIGFGAIDRVGEGGRVIFADLSGKAIERCAALAEELGVSRRCEFMLAPPDDLSVIGDESLEVVTMYQVLISVTDKQKAIDECYRVLALDGRLSVFEPVNRLVFPRRADVFMGFDVAAVQEIANKLRTAYGFDTTWENNPLLDFDERNLLAFAEQSGFTSISLRLEHRVEQHLPFQGSWERFLMTSPILDAPSLSEMIEQTLTKPEATRFTNHIYPLFADNRRIFRLAVAHLVAIK